MYSITKRLIDLIASISALILLIPLTLPIVVILRFTSEGEIFYLQERVGYKNSRFFIFKFATMLKASLDMKGGHITVKGDPRITSIGHFLRKSKINELPQLLNILKGEMSIVGPRPVLKVSFEAYPEKIQQVIYNIKPGLTGVGSIIFRDEEELITKVKNEGANVWDFYQNSIYPYKGELELWYQKNTSITTDMKIIFLTFWVILFPNSTLYLKWLKDLPKRSF